MALETFKETGQAIPFPTTRGGRRPAITPTTQTPTPTRRARYVPPRRAKKAGLDTIEGLQARADEVGVGDEVRKIVEDKDKIGALRRLGAFLGALSPTEAIMRARENVKEQETKSKTLGKRLPEFGKEYLRTIYEGLATGITGREVGREIERRGGKQVLEDKGMFGALDRSKTPEFIKRILKGGAGFATEIILSPDTWFGGAAMRGVAKTAKGLSKMASKRITREAPELLPRLAGKVKPLRDVFGRAFQYGYGTSEKLADRSLRVLSSLEASKEGVIADNLLRLGTKTLTKAQQQDLLVKVVANRTLQEAEKKGVKLVSDRVLNLAKKEAMTDDPILKEVLSRQIHIAKVVEPAIKQNDPFRIFFKGLDNKSISKVLRETDIGSKGKMMEFRDLMTNEQLYSDPVEIFSKAEYSNIKENVYKQIFKSITQDPKIGKPLTAFKNSDEALKEGYRLVKENFNIGKDIGYLKEVDYNFMDNLVNPKLSTIDMIAKATGFDALTALFKRSVTGLFPAFHIRNWASGVIQNYEALGTAALNPKNIQNGMKMALHLSGAKVIPSQIMYGKTLKEMGIKSSKDIENFSFGMLADYFNGRFGSSSSYIADIKNMTAPAKFGEVSKGTLRKVGESLLGEKAIHYRYARAVGNFIETSQKATAYLTAISKGKGLDEAIKFAERAGFDYRALTPFESQIMRRIIPFYSFCVPDYSEILTREGWKTYKELKEGDEVLSYNTDKGVNEWDKVKAIHTFEGDYNLMSISNKRGYEFLATKDHRWVVETKTTTTNGKEYGGIIKFKKGFELNTSDNLLLSAQTILPEKSILTEKEAKVLGWITTDGYFRYKKNHFEAMIYQSPKKYADEIRELLGDWKSSESIHPTTDVICFRINTKYLENIKKYFKSKNDLPSIITRLNEKALRGMFEAMFKAEGSIGKTKKMKDDNLATEKQFCQKAGGVLDGFQIACQLLGISYNFSFVDDNYCAGYLRNRNRMGIKDSRIKEVDYSGIVWCPETKNQSWIMRQKGKVIITGNTRKNIPLQLRTLGENPQRINQVMKFIKIFEKEPTTSEQEKLLPEFIREGFGISVGTNSEGLRKYLINAGTPIEAFTELFGDDTVLNVISKTNPILKAPIEIGIGKDSFRKRDLKDIYSAKDYRYLPQILKDFLQIKEYEKPEYKRNKKGELERVGMKKVWVGSPERLLIMRNLFTSRGITFFSNIFDENISSLDKFLKLGIGVSQLPIDIESQRFFKERDEKEEMIDILESIGKVKEMKIPYVPKEQRQPRRGRTRMRRSIK